VRIGIVADIHGNAAALEAVLAALERERVDRLVCLGDVAATGPQPAECLALLEKTGCPVVMGNTDADLLDPASIGVASVDTADDEDSRRIAEIDRWCAGQLGEREIAFLRSFAPTVEIDLGGGRRLLCVHGGPSSYHDVIVSATPEHELDRLLSGSAAAVIAGGHTHVPMVRKHRGTTLLNPGSVGLAYEYLSGGGVRVPPWAEFGLLTVDGDGARSIELRRVAYDRAATVRAMRERGMPHAGWWATDWS
jgi:predicted phosphodiesterase